MMDSARQMKAENYVLWGGRDGYQSLLNTSLPRELDQMGRFLSMVVDYRHKSGFSGALLIEPKPCEPCKHQYDHDVATVYGFLARYDLLGEVQLNLEANHATLAGHSFAHEVAYACALGLLGSIDANRGDPQNGWDTDQFPTDIAELSHIMTLLLQAGGFRHGGFNFDARLRRDSTDPADLIVAHVAGIDALARSLEIAEQLMQDRVFDSLLQQRYGRWDLPGHPVACGALHSLEQMSDYACTRPALPETPRGQQEWIEHRLATYL
jgi:xylose isomerase